jgi:endonuclease III
VRQATKRAAARHANGGRPPIDSRSVGVVLGILRRRMHEWGAPIVTLISEERGDPFLTLIGCVLSLRTKDETTAAASGRLFRRASKPQSMLKLTPRDLERLIFPVGFYRTKARTIRGICRDLIEQFGGRVPADIDQLLTLKGVGRKTANLVVTEAYGKPGICVDTHVHRISNRWGLVRTKTPEKTEMALRAVLPPRHWIEYNRILVAFGQTICQPVSPWCSRCPIEPRCPRIGVARSR